MTITVIIILLLIGFLLLLLEILVLPGTNVAGILGFILIAVAVWQAFEVYGQKAGLLTLGGAVIMTIVFLSLVLKSKTWKKLTLKSKIDGKVNVIEESKVKVGDTGKTVSRLAPSGKALINGDYYEVHTVGEFLDPNTEIIIIKIEFNKILIKQKNK